MGEGRSSRVATCAVQHALPGSAAAVVQETATAFHCPHSLCSLATAQMVQILYMGKSIYAAGIIFSAALCLMAFILYKQ